VAVFDAGEQSGRPYIVMELAEGDTLADELRRRDRLPVGEARELAAQAAAGLAHAHLAGVVHRDVKPGNLIRSNGLLKIADFGIAHAVEATRLTQTGTVVGTAAYLAPEQAAGREITPAADVYALGAVLYELLTGRPPHSADTLTELLSRKHAGPVVRPMAV
jgi:eukaryotic-like serine/threonine-protein kinase